MRAYVRECNLNVAKFFLLNHFRAGLPSELRRVLNLQNQDELRLNHAVKLATIEQRSREEAKNRNKIFATDISPQDSDDTQIDALRQNSTYTRQSSGRYQAQQTCRNNQQQPQNKPWRQNNQGNNSNRNGQTCIFCKMQNHRQEECQKRIKANKPCLDSKGFSFWPKINAADSDPTNPMERFEVPSFTLQDFQ
jgi:wobble nucleotide-excising tRNase